MMFALPFSLSRLEKPSETQANPMKNRKTAVPSKIDKAKTSRTLHQCSEK